MPDPPRLSKRVPDLQSVTETALPPPTLRYAELHCKTNFSFLEGASHPDELVQTAASHGYSALAVTDRNSLAGVVRAHVAAKEVGLKLLVGAEVTPADASPVVLLATDRKSYGRLARLLTTGRRRAPKGECLLMFDDLVQHEQGLLACVITSGIGTDVASTLTRYKNIFGDRTYALAERHLGCHDELHLQRLVHASNQTDVPLVAGNDVHYHVRDRSQLQDVVTAIRHGCEVGQLGHRMFPNSERYLKPIAQMQKLFADHPSILQRTTEVADRCTFSLDELRYEYPEELGPPGMPPLDYLKQLTWEGANERYPDGVPERVQKLILHEFELIQDLHYEAYFLTVWDLVRFARSRDILCQGRGSAANSVVCFCLGVTSVDPNEVDVLFERFISRARNEAPDIDVDFEHERREEVLQYLYNKYGRDRAGLAATVITYRGRSAAQDLCKALGFSTDRALQVSQAMGMWETPGVFAERIKESGLNPDAPTTQRLVRLIREIYGFPRHLSQHVGGMVMTNGPLCEMVPIENAAMADRTVVQWDKDDLEALGILKVDCLCLGMLTAIRKCFTFLERHYDRNLGLESIPGDETPESSNPVYDMICRADTIGVFQIESRAQMSMLPRLRPERFYDLVVEVAIVRPGPIQGNMVHPYLKNREKFKRTGETPDYPSDEIKQVLHKTYGVPIFQEQAMRLAVVAGGFSLEEADQLRRAMGKWRKAGLIEKFQKKLIEGIVNNGYEEEFAERLFKQICGFGDYGFPESHAASFARLTWISCWLKCYYPAAYTASILNSLPMGFYAPAQLVADVRRHGVEVRPVDVNFSDWNCTLERNRKDGGPKPNSGKTQSGKQVRYDAATAGVPRPLSLRGSAALLKAEVTTADVSTRTPGELAETHAIRLGFRMISGISESAIEAIVSSRQFGPFTSFENFV
ncbi:MAG: error-prone DNA polymerase, partial [Planctomycetaceae bacterium]